MADGGVCRLSARHGPTRRCSCSSGCSSQRLVAASLLVVVAVAVALDLGPSTGLALPFYCLGGWGVPDVTLCSLGALASQAEERRNILDVVGGELLQHHPLLPGEMQPLQKHWRYEEWYCEPERTA
jgi:hypothetical protein